MEEDDDKEARSVAAVPQPTHSSHRREQTERRGRRQGTFGIRPTAVLSAAFFFLSSVKKIMNDGENF